jgi:arginase
MPLANMPNPDSEPWGLTIDELVEALRAFTTDDRFAGLVLTEVNPGNAPDVTALDDYVQMIVAGVGRAGRVSSRSGHTPRAPHDDSVR